MRAKRYLSILVLLIMAVTVTGCLSFLRKEEPKVLAAVSGVVEREDGSLVSGAQVSLGDKQATTDAQGAYRITDVELGEYTLTVRLNDVVVYAVDIVVDQEEHIVNVEIANEVNHASVAGTVVDHKGIPVPGAQVQLAGQTAVTDAAGEFAFDDVVYGEHTLRVNHSDVQVYSEVLEIDDDTVDLDIELENVAIGWDDATVQVGTLPDSWYVSRGQPEIHEEDVSGRKALRIRPRHMNPNWDGAYLIFPETTKKAIVEFSAYTPGDVRTLHASVSYQANYPARATANYGASFTVNANGQLSYYAGGWHYFDSYVNTSQWNNYRLVVDVESKTFTVYANDMTTPVGTAPFRVAIDSVNQVEFSTFETSSQGVMMWVDNVRVTIIE